MFQAALQRVCRLNLKYFSYTFNDFVEINSAFCIQVVKSQNEEKVKELFIKYYMNHIKGQELAGSVRKPGWL